jgi:beta-phosphoglucomutase-like phosphatase (HAD superfamily)
MSKSAFQAFFFDFDGVIVDSVDVKTVAFARMFEPFGLEVVAKVVEHHRLHGGMNRMQKFQHYYSEFLNKSLDDKEIEDLCKQFSALVMNEVISAPEIPGAQAFLEKWYQEIPCFIVSATPQDELHEIVERRGLMHHFRELKGAPVDKCKNLADIISTYALKPESCLYFGDAYSDYEAAHACSANFWGILPGPDAPLFSQLTHPIVWSKNFCDDRLSLTSPL